MLMQLLFVPLSSRLLLLLYLLLLTFPYCTGLGASDVWSGSIWNKAQRARNKHASNSDRLMQHIWQRPDQAHKFVDCDILADSQTDKHFQFLNLYDSDDQREKLLNGLPTDGYVRGMWPVIKGKATVPYTVVGKLDQKLSHALHDAVSRWQEAASVKFVKSNKKPNLQVVLEGGCFATLGYHATEPRKLSLHPGRCTAMVITHLLGHVLGLPHPTSTVGRANEQYLMPHHAAPRSMGVLNTRAGAAFDPLDIMAVDPWFCGVHNRTTWRPLSPSQYQWAAVTGNWLLRGHRNPAQRSASTGLLQREIQLKAGTAGCAKKCDPCREFVSPRCDKCVSVVKMSDSAFEKLAGDNGLCGRTDMGTNREAGLKKIKVRDAPLVCSFFHSTNVAGLNVADDSGKKCWQCTLFVFSLHTNGLFNSKQNQLVALGSRCTLFSMEVNGALEEAWHRLCMHDLLHTNDGDVQLAFRGPGSVFIRYFGSEDVFPEFHKQFKKKVRVSFSVHKVENCKCSGGPGLEIQYSVNKQ